jgi:hypothetical protein
MTDEELHVAVARRGRRGALLRWVVGCGAIGVCGLAGAYAAAAQLALEPGMWRVTVTSTTNGEPNPAEDTQQCLGEELKDLVSYFAPKLEGANAQCTNTRQPSETHNQVAYRMQCRGAGFTVDALTSVTLESSSHFTATIRIDSRTQEESALVVANAQGHRTGACPRQ